MTENLGEHWVVILITTIIMLGGLVLALKRLYDYVAKPTIDIIISVSKNTKQIERILSKFEKESLKTSQTIDDIQYDFRMLTNSLEKTNVYINKDIFFKIEEIQKNSSILKEKVEKNIEDISQVKSELGYIKGRLNGILKGK